jgi:glutamate formiminotransferase/glutamate formiminotransferase/formiminotetrahydrofolate cyclodeaminase
VEPPILLAVPNVSEGRDAATIAAVGRAFVPAAGTAPLEDPPASPSGAVRLLDVHSDSDHHRSVFTIAGRPGALADALLAGARAAIERVDVMSRDGDGSQSGQHPHVGALDVAPIVYLDERSRGAACAEALVAADRIGEELGVPVFLYGELTASDGGTARTRAELRRGGVAGLSRRMAGGQPLALAPPRDGDGATEGPLLPDFGPPRMHPSAGATLLAARPPLVAFNLQLAAPASIADARRIAALIREGGEEGLPGVRAIAVALSGDIAQVSMNVERPFELSLAAVVEAVGRHAGIASAELVGLAPLAALEGFPADVPLPGFDPARDVIENALGC